MSASKELKIGQVWEGCSKPKRQFISTRKIEDIFIHPKWNKKYIRWSAISPLHPCHQSTIREMTREAFINWADKMIQP